jgi:hypothetical protein
MSIHVGISFAKHAHSTPAAPFAPLDFGTLLEAKTKLPRFVRVCSDNPTDCLNDKFGITIVQLLNIALHSNLLILCNLLQSNSSPRPFGGEGKGEGGKVFIPLKERFPVPSSTSAT